MLSGWVPESASGQAVLRGRDGATVVTCALLVVITAVAWAQVVSSAMTPDPMQGMIMAPTVFDGLVYVALCEDPSEFACALVKLRRTHRNTQ